MPEAIISNLVNLSASLWQAFGVTMISFWHGLDCRTTSAILVTEIGDMYV